MQRLNRSIVITRPELMAEEFALALKHAGFTPVVFPLIRLELHKNASNNLRKIQEAGQIFDWVLFTSPSAVHFYYRLLPNNLPQTNRVAVIGKKTAEVCCQYGVKVDFMPSQADFSTFVTEFKALNPENVLFPHSKLTTVGQLHQLHNELAAVKDFILYENVLLCHSQAEWEKVLRQVEAFTFFSPSAVNSFAKQIRSYTIQLPKDVVFFSIGKRTTEALRENSFQNTIITAPNGKTDEMLRQIKERIK